MLVYNLQKAGYVVEAASNGMECLQKIKTIKPRLIILDIMMPEMDGVEVCQQIKSDPKNNNILICFLTARSEDYSQIAALEAGGDDYVTKPIMPKVFPLSSAPLAYFFFKTLKSPFEELGIFLLESKTDLETLKR